MNLMDWMEQLFSTPWPGDPRSSQLPLMSNPYPTLALSALYLIGVKVSMDLMSDRKPLKVEKLLVWYNFFLVALNGCIFIKGGLHGWFGKYNVFCQLCDTEETSDNLSMVFTSWLFFISKFIEFADTGFFIIRKRNDLVTKLHLIHHSILPISCWFTVKYVPVGHSTFMGFLNSFVHILMYGYYAITAIGYRGRCYLLIKRNLTRIQMLQFTLMFVHSIQIVFNGCQFPIWTAWSNAGHAVLFFVLFADFYRSKYQKERKVHSPHQNELPTMQGITT